MGGCLNPNTPPGSPQRLHGGGSGDAGACPRSLLAPRMHTPVTLGGSTSWLAPACHTPTLQRILCSRVHAPCSLPALAQPPLSPSMRHHTKASTRGPMRGPALMRHRCAWALSAPTHLLGCSTLTTKPKDNLSGPPPFPCLHATRTSHPGHAHCHTYTTHSYSLHTAHPGHLGTWTHTSPHSRHTFPLFHAAHI